jgi:phosphoglycolate phosphatase
MMKYKHIIWDYNGTLLNDTHLCVEIINEMLKARNLSGINLKKYRELFDFPVKDYYERVGFSFDDESFEKVGTEFILQYDNRSNTTELQAGTEELIKDIYKKGIKQSVLSARKKEQLEEELEKFGIRKYFEYVYGLNDHYAGGKTEIGKELIQEINLPPEEIILIGDTTHDCEVANVLGIHTVAVSYGHHPAEKFKHCGIRVLNSVGDLKTFLFS